MGEIDFLWWVRMVEIPILAALIRWIWRNQICSEEQIDEVRKNSETMAVDGREALSAFKLEVAKNYVSISYLKDVEGRLTNHLLRIEKKLDEVTIGDKK